MGRYATREDEIDNLLRGKVLVDLYAVVRNALRAGVESYSIKKLEPLYDFHRTAALKDANIALASVQAGLELGDSASIGKDEREAVQAYNADDCALSYSSLLLNGLVCHVSLPIDHGWWLAAKGGVGSFSIVELHPFPYAGLRL